MSGTLTSGVNPQVPLQLVGVWRGVSTVLTLIWSFAGVTAHMAFQLAQFDTGVVAFVAPMWLLVRVTIPNVPNEFARGGERRVAVLAGVRLNAGVGIYMVVQRGHRLEAAFANAALVRALFAVRFHVSGEQVALVARVAAVVALVLRVARVVRLRIARVARGERGQLRLLRARRGRSALRLASAFGSFGDTICG